MPAEVNKGEVKNLPVGSRLNRNVRRFYKRYAVKLARRLIKQRITQSE